MPNNSVAFTRKDFLKHCVMLAGCGFPVAALPKSSPLTPRPHKTVDGTWCQCDDCELWDEETEERVNLSVKKAAAVFWKAIKSEYGLTGDVPSWAGQMNCWEFIEEQVKDWVTEVT